MNFSEDEINKIVKQIFDGKVTPTELPESVYGKISDKLIEGAKSGFGPMSIKYQEKDYELAEQIRQNIYKFSAAKTFQQTKEMSDALVSDKGDLLPFKEFKEAASEIFVKYNGGEIDGEVKPGWLEAEYNTAISQAEHARRWNEIEKQKELFPYLIRNEVEDSSECEECAAVNGICLPVDDPFWNENAGDLHFNCRGFVDQVEKSEGEDNEATDEELDEANESRVSEAFKYNPGKRGEVFATDGEAEHPYFSVPKEYEELKENNFDLPIPAPDFMENNKVIIDEGEFYRGDIRDKGEKLSDAVESKDYNFGKTYTVKNEETGEEQQVSKEFYDERMDKGKWKVTSEEDEIKNKAGYHFFTDNKEMAEEYATQQLNEARGEIKASILSEVEVKNKVMLDIEKMNIPEQAEFARYLWSQGYPKDGFFVDKIDKIYALGPDVTKQEVKKIWGYDTKSIFSSGQSMSDGKNGVVFKKILDQNGFDGYFFTESSLGKTYCFNSSEDISIVKREILTK